MSKVNIFLILKKHAGTLLPSMIKVEKICVHEPLQCIYSLDDTSLNHWLILSMEIIARWSQAEGCIISFDLLDSMRILDDPTFD